MNSDDENKIEDNVKIINFPFSIKKSIKESKKKFSFLLQNRENNNKNILLINMN